MQRSGDETTPKNYPPVGTPSPVVRRGCGQSRRRHYFHCNTCRYLSDQLHDTSLEDVMRDKCYAAAWEPFRWLSVMRRVVTDDYIFMFATGEGYVAVGEALAMLEGPLLYGDPNRIRPHEDNYTGREWRIPVKWLCTKSWKVPGLGWYPIPPVAFADLSGPGRDQLRSAVLTHFGIVP
jgi:hypothetical protein